MILPRVIPCLLLKENSLVKTINFKKPSYIGDPVNSVRIFNEFEVDELVLLDISATREKRKPNFELLEEIAEECFMPLAYGGGINSVQDAQKILSIGLEKVIINSEGYSNPQFISQLVNEIGSSSVVCSIDVKKDFFGKKMVFSHSSGKKYKGDVLYWVKIFEDLGAGEILLTSVDNEGTWKGFDTGLIKLVSSHVNVPVIASGGAGKLLDIRHAIENGASAAAFGNLAVYQGKGLGVLVSHPKRQEIEGILKFN